MNADHRVSDILFLWLSKSLALADSRRFPIIALALTMTITFGCAARRVVIAQAPLPPHAAPPGEKPVSNADRAINLPAAAPSSQMQIEGLAEPKVAESPEREDNGLRQKNEQWERRFREHIAAEAAQRPAFVSHNSKFEDRRALQSSEGKMGEIASLSAAAAVIPQPVLVFALPPISPPAPASIEENISTFFSIMFVLLGLIVLHGRWRGKPKEWIEGPLTAGHVLREILQRAFDAVPVLAWSAIVLCILMVEPGLR